MVKSNLVDIVKNNFRKSLLVGVMALTLNGCKKSDITPPVQSYPPGVALDVSETSGDSPLSVHMKVSSMDKDIVSYRLYLDGIVDSSSSPIDTTMTFYPSTHTVYGEAVNAKRLSSRTSTTSINITQKNDSWNNGYPLPKGKVNLFVYPDSTAEFNSKKNPFERKVYLEMIRANDITPTIPTGPYTVGGKDYGWACVQASWLFEINSMDLGTNPYVDDTKFYGWYSGDVIDSIYVHRGTLKFMGSHKAPIHTVNVSPSHQMDYAFTGNSLFDGKSLDLIETMYGISRSNVQFNGVNYPLDFPNFLLYYAYSYIDKNGHNSYANIPMVKYNLVNGVLNFVATNPNLDVIMERDTLPPVINVNSPVDGKSYSANGKILLDEVVTSGTNQISNESFRYAYYSFDGGQTKTAIRKKEHMDLIYNGNRYFKPGNYTLSLYAKNEFYNDASKNISFTVK